MISLNYVSSTDEHSWSGSRKMLSVEMDRRFQLYHGLTGDHILSHSVNGNAPV
jgi:hypothetical protein